MAQSLKHALSRGAGSTSQNVVVGKIKKRWLLAVTALASTASAAGPISKFDQQVPVADYVSARSIGEIERCLIEMDGWLAPNVYWQPDKPDKATLLWISGGAANGKAVARIDLRTEGSGTHVRSWMGAKQAKGCAPE